MVSMGKTYSRYRSFNDAVSLTIFIAIDNAQFVKFITEVQDKNSKIMPLAETMILRNLMDNRKHKLQEEQAQQYLEGVRQEENARANMDQIHIKFEILTELCDVFKKCENCRYLPCIDRKVMIELRDLFYDIEKHYFNMLDIGERFLECLDKEQERIKLLETETKIQNNTEELIELYKNQGLTDNVYLSQQDLQSIKKQIKNLEKSKLRLEEMNKAISEIQKEIDYIDKDARPKFIRYCKIYIDMKKEHARELRKTGNIQYNKMNEKL